MKYIKHKLKNGSSLGFVKTPGYYSATLSAFIPAGFKYDPQEKPGLAHFTEHMLFNGTKLYPSPIQQSWSIERFGGYLSAFTWIDYQQLIIHLPKQKYELGVELMFEMLTSPILSEREFKKEKGVIKEEILRNMSDPEKALLDYAWQPLFFEGTKLARPYSGTVKDIDKLTSQDIKEFFKKHFTSKLTTYLLSADTDSNKAEKIFNTGIKKFSGQKSAPYSRLNVKSEYSRRVKVYPYKTEHMSIALGVKTVGFNCKEKHILDFIKDVLGGYFGARLPQKFRAKGGLIYNWNIWQDNLMDTGYLVFISSTTPKNINPFIQIVLEEFHKLTAEDIGQEELEVVRGHIIGSLFCNTQTGLDFVNWYGLQEFFTKKSISLYEQAEIYRKITPEDILKTAQIYLSHDKVLIAAVGDIDEVDLEKLLR